MTQMLRFAKREGDVEKGFYAFVDTVLVRSCLVMGDPYKYLSCPCAVVRDDFYRDRSNLGFSNNNRDKAV